MHLDTHPTKKIKIKYCFPTYRRQVCLDTMFSFYRDMLWINSQDKYELDVEGKEGIGIHLHRNSAIQGAIKDGCRYLFMIDADVYGIDKSPLKTLMGSLKKFNAVAAGAAVVCRTNKVNSRAYQGGRVMRGWIGTGMILIDVKKLVEKVKPPWFKFRDNEDGTQIARGEDFYFCEKCEKHGLTTVVDATMITGHRGERALIYHPEHGPITDDRGMGEQ